MNELVLGVDPGRDKTGFALVSLDGAICLRTVIETPRLREELRAVLQQWPIARIALGDSTSSKPARAQIEEVLDEHNLPISLHLVNEKNSTLEARSLYFHEFPPRGWKRLIPLSAQVPPVPVDDFAAAVVARRLIEQS